MKAFKNTVGILLAAFLIAAMAPTAAQSNPSASNRVVPDEVAKINAAKNSSDPHKKKYTAEKALGLDKARVEVTPSAGNMYCVDNCAGSKKESGDKDAESSINWWTMFFTGCSALIAFVQAYFFWRQLNKMDDTMSATNQTIVAMERQGALQNAPDVRPRRFSLEVEPPFTTAALVAGDLQLVNWGGETALILDSHCEVLFLEGDLPMRQPSFYRTHECNQFATCAGRNQLTTGEAWWLPFGDRTPFAERAVKVENGTLKMYVIGYLSYQDETHRVRVMHHDFARVYCPGKRRFVEVEDADYNNRA